MLMPWSSADAPDGPSAEAPVSTTTDRATSRRAKLRCSVSDCNHEGLFARQYELDRHISTKHSDYKPFHCGAINCFNKTLPWTFARADKLADHVRAKHHREVLFSDCPAESCDIGPRTLEALAIHICLAHPTLPGEARAIVSVALGQKRKCPWWRCANTSHVINSWPTLATINQMRSLRLKTVSISKVWSSLTLQ